MTTFDVTTMERPDGVQVALSGELDLASAQRLEDELKHVEELEPGGDRPGPPGAHASWTRAACAPCCSADSRARERGGRLVIVRGDERVQRVLRITRLDERLEIVDSADAVV